MEAHLKIHFSVADKGRPRSKKITESGRGKRYSYKLPQEYNIETVVVADPAMVSYHGADAARRFILTILNMVFNLFQHKSLGVQVNLRVIKLILLHETPADLYIGHHGEKMLESFCKWQHEEFGKKNDIHLEMSTSWGEDMTSVDAAILITRKDFCVHKDEPCDTVGIAYLSGMCSEKRKCIIAEDNGLNLAFTIAHEMGHKSKASNCLLQTSPQSANSVMVPSKLPGMTYTADEQCQILFGPLASFCQEMQHVICTGLWCKVEGEKECRTKLDPPMDGTDCDPGKGLLQGKTIAVYATAMGNRAKSLKEISTTPEEQVWKYQSKNQTKIRNVKSTKKRDLLRTRDLLHDLLTLAGYVEVLVIPTGARRIKVVEEKPAHSYLALRDTGKQSINSDWKIEHSGAFTLAGTTVHYIRRGLWEKISAKGPTTSPLHLLVLLFQDQNYGLHYEYTIPSDPPPENQSSKAPGPLFMWTHTGWEDCDATCGGGERKTTVSCTKIMNKNISIVDSKKCKYLTKPEPQIRKCNEQPCQTRWMMTEWTPCSRTCGKGMQSRQVACTQQLSNGTLIRARERDCAGPKPASAQRCEGQDCMTVWEAGVWSECSVKCGKGVRQRTVRCTNPRKKCVLSTRPRESEDCEDYSKCYLWRMGDWSKCSITCGKGMQSRVIQCMHKVTGRHGNECFSSEKPAAYRPCHLQPCNEKINTKGDMDLSALPNNNHPDKFLQLDVKLLMRNSALLQANLVRFPGGNYPAAQHWQNLIYSQRGKKNITAQRMRGSSVKGAVFIDRPPPSLSSVLKNNPLYGDVSLEEAMEERKKNPSWTIEEYDKRSLHTNLSGHLKRPDAPASALAPVRCSGRLGPCSPGFVRKVVWKDVRSN
ncbi:A disintegrin and metalloproteinase with thrombospondin motifs 19 [Myotis davidii]|uniref:A disintegrin and metalloproteinase with thrombospondin motifs 19 n=1 Tax=Myotis davidii TaxID=225400 RepID=L5LV20_MYODS|nr:A disintegrin and metalloproteinase with thrombospondin motifs 19 [Myotis davidii]